MRFSASKRALLDQCGYAFRSELELPEDTSSPAAALGTHVHALIEAFISRTESPACPEGVDAAIARTLFARWSDWYAEWSSEHEWEWFRAEVPYALDLVTGAARELPSDGARDYSRATATEITGTVDFVGKLTDGTIVVRDWKTTARGNLWGIGDHSPQLRTLALFVARALDVDSIDVGAVHVSSTEVREVAFVVDVLDLDADYVAIGARLDAVPESVPVVGPSCKWCRARAICPAQVSTEPANDGGALAVLAAPGDLAPDVVAKAYVQIKLIEERITAAKARVRAEVERMGGVALGGGRELRIVDVERETLSKASIAKAFGDEAPAMIGRLRELGALKISTHRQMSEGKAR